MSGILAGRRIVVSGASGGIGRVIASSASAEGAAVGLLGRNRESLESLGLGPAAVADVSDAAAVASAVAELAGELGGIDGLVTAAAIDCAWAPTAEMELEEWDRTIATNLSGAFYTCRFTIPHLLSAGGGAIVNITSVAGIRAWPEDVAYNASKAGVELLSKTIAVEYASQNVRSNCVAPGAIDAGMTDLVTDERERARLEEQHPVGRFGVPEEVAATVIWLLSERASYVTGTTVPVDGGFLA